MKKQLQGIALILFSILFCNTSDVLQSYLWAVGIGVSIPWAVIALIAGIVGLTFVFAKDKNQ